MTEIDRSRLHRALDIATSIALSERPARAAESASANDTLDLALAVVALDQLGILGVNYLVAQEEALLDANEMGLDTPERLAASEAADLAVGSTHDALCQALAAYGYGVIGNAA